MDHQQADALCRSRAFEQRSLDRYWWHQRPGNQYVPAAYSFLDDAEWQILAEWFRDTDGRQLASEMSVPMISILQGFVMGSGIRRIVQLGHYAGYSALMLGFMLRHMGCTHGLFSVDIDAKITSYTRQWIERAGLSEQVQLVVSTSEAPQLPEEARQYLGGGIQLIVLDTSHSYAQTVRELDLWCCALEPRGLIFLHDSSLFAQQFDGSFAGGVHRALREGAESRGMVLLNLNGDVTGGEPTTYADICGLGILYKPANALIAPSSYELRGLKRATARAGLAWRDFKVWIQGLGRNGR